MQSFFLCITKEGMFAGPYIQMYFVKQCCTIQLKKISPRKQLEGYEEAESPRTSCSGIITGEIHDLSAPSCILVLSVKPARWLYVHVYAVETIIHSQMLSESPSWHPGWFQQIQRLRAVHPKNVPKLSQQVWLDDQFAQPTCVHTDM